MASLRFVSRSLVNYSNLNLATTGKHQFQEEKTKNFWLRYKLVYSFSLTVHSKFPQIRYISTTVSNMATGIHLIFPDLIPLIQLSF
jgi:hypothetical protein